MKRTINKVAVLGSGVMGSRIACHFANVGVEVLLLDIVPKDAEDNKKARNAIVDKALADTIKSNPSPLYQKAYASRITTGNFDDDLEKIADCDWIIEAIIEVLDIKVQLFEKVDGLRKPGTLVSSNTSGIPIQLMTKGRSDDFQKHFCGTHFFNPPRYLPLLELIPTPQTDAGVLEFLQEFGQKHLGKTTVLCKDTPAFIANRIGVFSIMSLFHLVDEMDMGVTEIDRLTGPVLGRPKSATFRTCDVVGLDTLVKVAKGLEQGVKDDEANASFSPPSYINHMVDNNWLGSKSGQGFYKKVKEDGKSVILALNLKTLEYEPKTKVKYATLEMAKTIDDLPSRTQALFAGKDKAGEFYRKSFLALFAYVSNRIPEISDELYKIDDAMRAGFGWELPPFEAWDAIGVKQSLALIKEIGHAPAQWVVDMVNSGIERFYKVENGQKFFYNQTTQSYELIPGQDEIVRLDLLRHNNVVWRNSGTTLTDLGDGVLNLCFHTKMNTIGGEVIAGINKAINIAEEGYKGLVIANDGQNFSAGANVGMIFMMAVEQELDELDFAIRAFQNTMMRVRYSNIPIVVAPHGMTLGGACELSLHADKVVAHAETYMGLVEFGVGVIPGGGGTKEFALRASDEFSEGGIRLNVLRNRFLTIGQAKVSTSAKEAFELGYLRNGIDEIVVSRQHQIATAKRAVIDMAQKGYTPPVKRSDIKVLGNEGLGIVYVGANSMLAGKYISQHDELISKKLGEVLCGGPLSSPTEVSEDYLLKLERKAFVELCLQRKTLERMQSLLTTGKILRN